MFVDVCRTEDDDALRDIPAHHEDFSCPASDDAKSARPLFEAIKEQLPADFMAVHAVCAGMNPAKGTHDHENPAMRAALHDLFVKLVQRPSLKRVLADLPDDINTRVKALETVWLEGNAFEHVMCGEVNSRGTVGGMHLWSEYYLDEVAGRAKYVCSKEGRDDPFVATFRCLWKPRGQDQEIVKPVGGFAVGMTPACMLAIGYQGYRHGCQSSGLTSAFKARTYQHDTHWVIWRNESGKLLTLFPLANDAAGVRGK